MNIFKNQKTFKNKPNKINTLRTTQQAFLVSAVKWALFMADCGWTRLWRTPARWLRTASSQGWPHVSTETRREDRGEGLQCYPCCIKGAASVVCLCWGYSLPFSGVATTAAVEGSRLIYFTFFAFGDSRQWQSLPDPGQPQCIETFLVSRIRKPGDIAGLSLFFFFFKELWNPFLNKIWGNPTRRVRVANGAVLGALPALLSSRHRLLRLGHNLQTKNLYNFSHLISEKTAHSTKSTADPK